ncbi:uncharacterized protein LOC110984809 [Acanthaster planci]|uniref:Uncharacterized protein LOC110984809 n=1 Tax=Acanthaster planci TaxID=133434 RepID=A0A8B7Z7V2_ACAPL|nr:uncharacterized protein LOC110984809 [Acanthaster planci]
MEQTQSDPNFIKTFVFLDLETTSLLPMERPKIMEICLVAVHREALLSSSRKDLALISEQIPRVVDKLCVYPNKNVSEKSFQLTKLDNFNLAQSCKKILDVNAATMLTLFLSRQEGPVCLVAHNGDKFDFRILRTELHKLEQRLGEDILCADSLKAYAESDERTQEDRTVTVSYAMEEIYSRTFGRSVPDAHNAESDAMALIRIMVARADIMCKWMDENAIPFNDIELYYIPSPHKNSGTCLIAMSTDTRTIQTFVFFDLETTSPDPDDCKITEISLYAINRWTLEAREANSRKPPRIADKLVLCVDPEKAVSAGAADLTSLTQRLLRLNQRGAFGKGVAKLIRSFLEIQASPVCLVAHNGDRFDFPILARHFREVEVGIPEESNILCACTLRAFVKLEPELSDRKLVTLYSRYVGGVPPAAHSAEGDCLTLLHLVHHKVKSILPWIDKNAICFSEDFSAAPVYARAIRQRASATERSSSCGEMPDLKRSHTEPK